MERHRGRIIVLLLAILVFGEGVFPASLPADPGRVLILYSYHDQLPWQRALIDAVREAMPGGAGDPVLFEERMDANRFPRPEDEARIGAALLEKYRGQRFRAVITESDPAARFLLAHPEAFDGSPRLFVHTNLPIPSGAGVSYESLANYGTTLELIPSLMPQLRRLVLVDSDPVRAGLIQKYWQDHLASSYSLEVWKDISFGEMDAKAAALSRGTAILFGVFNQDRLGRVSIAHDVVERVSRLAPVPTFVLFSSLMGTGSVGGSVLSATEVGHLMGRLARGEAVTAKSVSFYRMMFDANALARWKIDRARLPAGSQILGEPLVLLSGQQIASGLALGFGIALLVTSVWLFLLLRAIQRRKRAESGLAKLQLAVDQARWGLAISNAEGTRSEVINREFARMHGYEPDELTGGTIAHLHSPASAESFDEIRGKARELGSYTADTLQVRKDGSLFPALVTITNLEALGKRDGGFVANVLDITDRVAIKREKEALQTQLIESQKMESLGRLSGGIAHDMNNVLAAILTTASTKTLTLAPGDANLPAFEKIAKAATRGGKMVKSLLSFARQSPAELRPVDLNVVLGEVEALLEHVAGASTRLLLERAIDLRPVLGDANALVTAVVNLVLNSLDALEAGVGFVALRTRNQGPWVEVVVEDTGTGMPPEVLEKALEPFFTTKAPGKGTGLGLSMVYATVKAHGGKLELSSQPGLGTKVVLKLPAGEKPPEASAEPHPEVTPGRVLRVLLIDDDELVRDSIRDVLIALGHDVKAVGSGERGLELLEAGSWDPEAVVLDMTMPGLGGAGTLPRLKELRPRLPVLLATGKADQSALNLVARFPGTVLLSKPFRIEELRDALLSATARTSDPATGGSGPHPGPQNR